MWSLRFDWIELIEQLAPISLLTKFKRLLNECILRMYKWTDTHRRNHAELSLLVVLRAVANRLLSISSAQADVENNASSGAWANQSAAFWRWGRVKKNTGTARPRPSGQYENTTRFLSFLFMLVSNDFLIFTVVLYWFPSFHSTFVFCFVLYIVVLGFCSFLFL